MTEHNMISRLLHKQMQGTISAEERKILDEWRNSSPDNSYLWEELNNEALLTEAIKEYHPDNKQALRNRILQKIRMNNRSAVEPRGRVRFLPAFRVAAASLLILISAGAYFLIQHNRQEAPAVNFKPSPAHIPPGRTGAVLTLSNGTRVLLDSLGNGVVTNQHGMQVVLNKGWLAYKSVGNTSAEAVYNTISTTKGKQFQLMLPDGTKVWLNSASSLKYPTIFTGTERKVEMTGEAYFEVVKDKKMPFHVNIGNQAELEVLGTHFNVNAYENDKRLNATLLEGAVRILPSPLLSSPGFSTSAGRTIKAVVLRPGQQAQINRFSTQQNKQQGITVVDNTDIDKVMAWKNGVFNFEDDSLEEIMHQLERWYDIEVVYDKDIPNIQLGGELSRNKSLELLLKDLQDVGVHFRIEGRKLIVLK